MGLERSGRSNHKFNRACEKTLESSTKVKAYSGRVLITYSLLKINQKVRSLNYISDKG